MQFISAVESGEKKLKWRSKLVCLGPNKISVKFVPKAFSGWGDGQAYVWSHQRQREGFCRKIEWWPDLESRFWTV